MESHLRIAVCMVFIVGANCFLLEDGQCINYGECGPGFNTQTVLNCPATDENRHGPILNGTTGLAILKAVCPNLYKGDTSTKTCCSESQLITFQKTIGLARQMLGACPSCTRNFEDLFCQVACGLNQDQFIWPNMTHAYPANYSYTPAGIPSTTIVLSPQYAEEFYSSCKDIQFLGMKAISLFCGTTAENCTAQKLLDYMGTIYNGVAPFPIQYILQDRPWTSPDNKVLTPLKMKTVACNEPVPGSDKACPCDHCPASCGPAKIPCPSGHIDITQKLQSDKNAPQFRPAVRRIQVVVSRPNNLTKVRHDNPPPVPGYINFSSIFAKEFMHQVLDLQEDIANHPVQFNGSTFTLNDICSKPSFPDFDGCAIESVLQYWQNNRTHLDESVSDAFDIYVLANYLDHFLSCTKNPYAIQDTTRMNMTCRADDGAAMKPMDVLGGFDGINYQDATSFIISFYVNAGSDNQRSQADAWEIEIDRYLQIYKTPDMAICFWPN